MRRRHLFSSKIIIIFDVVKHTKERMIRTVMIHLHYLGDFFVLCKVLNTRLTDIDIVSFRIRIGSAA